MSTVRPKIGISACFLPPDASRTIFLGKTLEYVERSMAHWLESRGALPVLIPSPATQSAGTWDDYAAWLDGLVLEGGADVWPGSYGRVPERPEWSGDRARDEYEIALLTAFVHAGKPVLGVCRGLQLLNVAYGGTLTQDLATHRPGALSHRDPVRYDANVHEVELVPGGRLSALFGGAERGLVNSVHHQAIEELAPGLEVEARSCTDGVIEAVRVPSAPYVFGVQWHPEFSRSLDGTLDRDVLLDDFLDATRAAVRTRR